MKLPNVPKPPSSRLILEGDTWYKCGICHSSMHRKYKILKTPYYMQPTCINYYKLHMD